MGSDLSKFNEVEGKNNKMGCDFSKFKKVEEELPPLVKKYLFQSIEIDFFDKKNKNMDERSLDDGFLNFRGKEVSKFLQIFIKHESGKIISINAEPNDTIKNVKIKIQAEINVLPENQILLFAGKSLEDHRTLADYNISNNFGGLRLQEKKHDIMGKSSEDHRTLVDHNITNKFLVRFLEKDESLELNVFYKQDHIIFTIEKNCKIRRLRKKSQNWWVLR
jgi:hypothetical protein